MADTLINEIISEISNEFLIPSNPTKKIIIKEEDRDAKLRKIEIRLGTQIKGVAIVLDVDNLSNTDKIYPYFRRTLGNPTDAVLILKKKSDDRNLYILYIELKSRTVNNREIYKKYVFTKNNINHILSTLDYKYKFGEDSSLLQNLTIKDAVIVFKYGNTEDKGRKGIKFTDYSGGRVESFDYNMRSVHFTSSEKSMDFYIKKVIDEF